MKLLLKLHLDKKLHCPYVYSALLVFWACYHRVSYSNNNFELRQSNKIYNARLVVVLLYDVPKNNRRILDDTSTYTLTLYPRASHVEREGTGCGVQKRVFEKIKYKYCQLKEKKHTVVYIG